MKTALSLCLLLLSAATAVAQDEVEAEIYTITSFGASGSGSNGTMVFASDGTFGIETSAGAFEGFFLEGADPATGSPVRYAIYTDASDQIQFVYAQTMTFDLSGVPILLIYGLRFGASGGFEVFGGYNFSLDLSNLPF